MIPQNDNDAGAMVLKELSWIDRMQQKLETLCEREAGMNSGEVLQETSAFFENHISTLGTNVKKFCAEFVQELLLPADDACEKSEVSPTENSQSESATPKGDGVEKAVKVVDKPVFHMEGSSAAVMPVLATLKVVHPVNAQAQSKEEDKAEKTPITPLNEAANSSVSEDSQVLSTGSEQSELAMSSSSVRTKEEDAEEYAQWYVSEEYRRMRLGKSSSTSSVESWDGHQRVGSTDSLLDWELI